MNERIFIAIACHNRRAVAEQCLPTMRDSTEPEDHTILYNDGSTEYDGAWLGAIMGYYGGVTSRETPIGIQAQRRLHLQEFLGFTEYTHLYFTDHDAIHDPTWRANALRIQAKYGAAPLCLYDTVAHVRLAGNTIEDRPDSEVIWRRVAPGVSYLLTREHVERLAPYINSIEHFDWQIPALLGGRFAVTRLGYCDHIGIGGAHHPAAEGADGGDRVRCPTPWLIQKRAEVVAALSQTV
jgi:hypothetical protein